MHTKFKARFVCRQTKPHASVSQADHGLLEKYAGHDIHEMNKPKYPPHSFSLNGRLDKLRGRDRRESRVFMLIHVERLHDLESKVYFRKMCSLLTEQQACNIPWYPEFHDIFLSFVATSWTCRRHRAWAVARLRSQTSLPAPSNMIASASWAKGFPAKREGVVRSRGCFERGAASAHTACRRCNGTRLCAREAEKVGLWMMARAG